MRFDQYIEAHDQCTPEACECGNSRTHALLPWFFLQICLRNTRIKRKQETTFLQIGFWIQVKHSATTVDGSPCFYCLDSKSSIFPSKIGGFMTPRWSHQWSGLGKARDSHVRDCSPSLGDLAFWKEPGIAEKNLLREEHHKTSPWIYRYTSTFASLDFNFNFMMISCVSTLKVCAVFLPGSQHVAAWDSHGGRATEIVPFEYSRSRWGSTKRPLSERELYSHKEQRQSRKSGS